MMNIKIFVMNVVKPDRGEKIILNTLLIKNMGPGKFVVMPHPIKGDHVNNQFLNLLHR